MKNLVSFRAAGTLALALLSLLALFHAAVLLKLLPGDMVWGGQMAVDASNLFLLESIALAVTLIFILLVAIRLGCLGKEKFIRLGRIGMWVIFGFFLLNVVGNLASPVLAEKLIFIPVSLILVLLSLRMTLRDR